MNNIYFFWWQGLKNAPSIIKICFNSIMNFYDMNNQKIILIDSSNYKNYVDVPEYIIDKLEKKIISITHFSDYIRFKLLYENGGLWIDSSILLTRKLDNSIFKKELFVLKNPSALKNDITSKWECFLIGGEKNNKLFKILVRFWEEYWKREDLLITYLLTENVFYYAYKNDSQIQKWFDESDSFYYPINYFQKIINRPFNEEKFNEIVAKENFIKLTYKMKFIECNNKTQTFYGRLKELYYE